MPPSHCADQFLSSLCVMAEGVSVPPPISDRPPFRIRQLRTVGKGFDYEKEVLMNKACLCYFGFGSVAHMENDFKQTVEPLMKYLNHHQQEDVSVILFPVLNASSCAQLRHGHHLGQTHSGSEPLSA